MLEIAGKTPETIYIDNKEVSQIEINNDVVWTKTQPSIDYFYIENTYNGSNTVTLTTVGFTSDRATSVEYSKDKENWTSLSLVAGQTNTISMNQGEKVYFRNDSGVWSAHTSKYTSFSASENHKAGGNVKSLLDYTNLNSEILVTGCFVYLFNNDSKLVDISDLKLTSNVLQQACHQNMFYGCSGITTIPENFLPATTIASSCYLNMFQNCTGITTIPENLLPATTLSENCYRGMFGGCSSLTKSPLLIAKTLSPNCYRGMFINCSSLNEVKIYANDISASDCLLNWLNGVSATGDFYNLGGATYPSGISGIPSGWTEHTSL